MLAVVKRDLVNFLHLFLNKKAAYVGVGKVLNPPFTFTFIGSS